MLPIAVSVALALAAFGVIQVRTERARMLDDLQRRAGSVAESMEMSVKYILLNHDLRAARRLVSRFQARDHLQGCTIYDARGRGVAGTRRFADAKDESRPYLKALLKDKVARGALETTPNGMLYRYDLPVLDDRSELLGLVEVIYDTSFMFANQAELWRRLGITLIFSLALIAGVVFFLQRRLFTLPLRRLTEWFLHFQKGEIDERQPILDTGDLGRLASEVEQVALSLRISRKSISEKAQARLQKDEWWTETKLRSLVQARLGEKSLVVVSNREPYQHQADARLGHVKCLRPPSGVVTALDPILRACGGTWIAHGSGNADRRFVNSRNKLGVPPEDDRYILKRVWLTKEEEDGYYYGFANEGLWPLCHITHTRPEFRESDWEQYRKVNRLFAQAVLEELPAKNPYVFIQDYHFTLLGRMIKRERPDAVIAMFWHIPWPNPETFAICPYRQDILDGMLGCDLVGFHVQYHCNNFLDTVNRMLEARVDTERFSVVRLGEETLIKAYPISVAGPSGQAPEGRAETKAKIREEHDLQDKIVALGVDRIDYSKGIIEKILAVDRFLDKYPQYKNRFVLIQIAAPSRTHIKRYHDLMGEIDELVEKKNWKHSDGNWKPIIFLKRNFSPEEIAPFYELADMCVVSSLHDGMNLVAKEYIVSKTDLNGVLLLSCFTGAARELNEALEINPYSIEEFADAIRTAAEMPAAEKRKRLEAMQAGVLENNIYRWAGSIITDLTSLKRP